MFLCLSVVFGILIGLLCKGKLNRLAGPSLRGLYLPAVGLLLQSIGNLHQLSGLWGGHVSISPEIYFFCTIISYLLLFVFVILNFRFWAGASLSLLGTFCNFVVILINHGRMPVSPAALDILHISDPSIVSASMMGYAIADAHTRLYFLGDLFYVPIPPIDGFISVGDILLSLGVMVLIIQVMLKGLSPEDQKK